MFFCFLTQKTHVRPTFLITFACVMKKHMFKIAHFIKARSEWFGLPMVYTGVLLLACFYATGLTDHNAFLLFPLAVIIAGVAGYVFHEKHSGRY